MSDKQHAGEKAQDRSWATPCPAAAAFGILAALARVGVFSRGRGMGIPRKTWAASPRPSMCRNVTSAG